MWPWSRNPGKLKRHTYGNEKSIINRAYRPVIQLELCWLRGKYCTNTWNGRNFCPLPFLHWMLQIILMHVFFLLLKKNADSKGSHESLFSFYLFHNNGILFSLLIAIQNNRFPYNVFLPNLGWILPCSHSFPLTLSHSLPPFPTPVSPVPLSHVNYLVHAINI